MEENQWTGQTSKENLEKGSSAVKLRRKHQNIHDLQRELAGKRNTIAMEGQAIKQR